MKKSIRELHSWVKAHPYKACLFAIIMSALGAWDGTRPYLAWIDLLPWALLLAAAALVIHWDGKGLVCLLIAALLCQPFESRAQEAPAVASPREPAAAGAIVAVVIIVIGGYIIFRVVRFCDHAFPRTPATNNPPAVIFGASHNYALASSCSALGTCYLPEPSLAAGAESSAGTVFEFSGVMAENPNGGLAFRMEGAKKLEDEGETVDLMEFQRELQEWGVRFGSVGEVFYGVDGQPAAPDQVPITLQLNGTNPLVDASDPFLEHRAVVFERSSDLQHWEPILTLTVSVGQVVKFSDATSAGQMFYRSRPVGD